MLTYIYQSTSKAFSYLASILKYLDDSRDPFEAGDLIEIRESVEYIEAEPQAPQMPAELIAKILSNIKDPEKIANLMQINRTWYREGSRRLNKDREELMDWLRLNRIEQLDPFIRYLKLDRLGEYIRINNSNVSEYKKAFDYLEKVQEECEILYNNLKEYKNESNPNIDENPNVDEETILFDELFDFHQDEGSDNEWEELRRKYPFDDAYEEIKKIYEDKHMEESEALHIVADLYRKWEEFRSFVFENVSIEMNNMIY